MGQLVAGNGARAPADDDAIGGDASGDRRKINDAPLPSIRNDGGLRGTSETDSSMTCARATFSGRAKNLRFPVDQLPRSPPSIAPHSHGKSGWEREAVIVRGRRRGPAVNARPTDYYYTTAAVR